LVGVADLPTALRAAEAMAKLGRCRAMAVTSVEGCDEFSPKRDTDAILWNGHQLLRGRVRARELLPSEDRRGSWGALPPRDAAEETRRILAGGGGARRGSVLLTAGAALEVAGTVRTLSQGVETARQALDSGQAEQLLSRMTELATQYRSPEQR